MGEIVLWAAAAYNLVIGGAGLLQKEAGRDARVVGLLVVCFGLVYALVAGDPARFLPILWAGVLGKIGVIALLGPAVRRGEFPKAVGLVLAGDALFTLAFLAMLLHGV
ncbi:hypothetical protein B0I00_1345 [Novosphingobium kunmingense]|uniref:Uncharacterized protein n=1 Tax=Novosphingobium kunmingense TaxID=1211806 RepID=A0A2N0HJK9_9SPHN|nr:hypothetical protein [Novosphingobium kunmingense]PKB19117.1 hypothetical protein B0I00_1345 [Novosphingobium kunmingense]